jgi:hypothetical protein
LTALVFRVSLKEPVKELKNYLDKLSTLVITKDNNELGEYNKGKISLVTTRYGDAIKYTKGKDTIYINITSKELTLEDAVEKVKDKLDGKLESGTLLGSDTTSKYYQTTAKFGPVIKQVDTSSGKIEYRSIKNCKDDINLSLAKKLFAYPKVINKTVSLNYNLAKDSYYLKDETKFISFPKENLEMSKADMLKFYEENKDAAKAKPKPKFIKKA